MSGLLTNTSHLFSFGQTNSMLRFVMDSAPTVREQRIDSKKDLDLHLKRACEAFIADSSSQLTGPMAVFLKEVADYAFALKPESEPALSSQSWAGPETVKEIASETLRQLKKDYPKLLESMGLYLRNRETEWILFKPIKANVLGIYRQFQRIVQENYSEEGQMIIACSPLEHISLLLTPSIFNARPIMDASTPELIRTPSIDTGDSTSMAPLPASQ